MYCRGLGLRVIGRFENHEGFDGVMLALPNTDYHFEFTRCRLHPIAPSAALENLIVFYIPAKADWERTCADMLTAGFKRVPSFNPYWEIHGRTYEDPDGYRTVLQRSEWSPD